MSHEDGSVLFDGDHVMPQLVPAHGGLRPKPDIANVPRRIVVAVVPGTTFRAFPMSHSEHVHTRGA